MTTMRVSVLRGVHDVAVEDRPAPTPGPEEVLVRVGSVGVCGSDVHYYEHGRIGPYVVESPLVLGHEAGGEVAAVGAEVSGLKVGTAGLHRARRPVSLLPAVPARPIQPVPGRSFLRHPALRRGVLRVCRDAGGLRLPGAGLPQR
jgi:L-iditol 2-dehydrogenase